MVSRQTHRMPCSPGLPPRAGAQQSRLGRTAAAPAGSAPQRGRARMQQSLVRARGRQKCAAHAWNMQLKQSRAEPLHAHTCSWQRCLGQHSPCS